MLGCTILETEPAPKDCEADFSCFKNSFEKCEPVVYEFLLISGAKNKKIITSTNDTCVYEGILYNIDGKRIQSNIITFKKPMENCTWKSYGNTLHGYLTVENKCVSISQSPLS